jgi:hypothetical protein
VDELAGRSQALTVVPSRSRSEKDGLMELYRWLKGRECERSAGTADVHVRLARQPSFEPTPSGCPGSRQARSGVPHGPLDRSTLFSIINHEKQTTTSVVTGSIIESTQRAFTWSDIAPCGIARQQ